MSLVRNLVLLLVGAGAAACGAGLVTGALANNQGGSGSEASLPQLSLPEPRLPLAPPATVTGLARTVVVANTQLPVSAQLRVEVRAVVAGQLVTAPQRSPTVLSGQGNSTIIGFELDMEPIVAVVGDPSATADLDGELMLLVDGQEIADPVPVELLRQPAAWMEGGTQQFLSPLGGTQVLLRLSGLRATSPADLQVFVTTRDPNVLGAEVTRPCNGVELVAEGDEHVVRALVPGNTFSGLASLSVDDRIAGESTEVNSAFYGPDVSVALPAQGPTTGGTLVTLIGRALAPLETSGQPAPAFDRLEILFRKGGREVALPAEALRRAESSLDRLVFTMPPSPNGRPGRVDIVLRASLEGEVTVEAIADRVFLFGNAQPVFGPRGAVLDRQPVDVAAISLEAASSILQAPDFGVLYSEGGVAFLELLMAEENGMFIRFGAPKQIGDPEVLAERDPRDLVAGDFDGDGVPDLAIINAGGITAAMHIVPGRLAPDPPLGDVITWGISPGMDKCGTADFDRDGLPDLVLFPEGNFASAQQPQLLLSRSLLGEPRFAPEIEVPVRSYDYEGFDLSDLDGDGFVDVIVATGGLDLRVDVAFGDGLGGFSSATQLDVEVPNYIPDSDSALVGIHVVRFLNERSLALVMEGSQIVSPHPITPPVVCVIKQPQPRILQQPLPANVLTAPTPLGASLVANMNRDAQFIDEMVVSASGDNTAFQLGLLTFNGNRFEVQGAGVQNDGEVLQSISSLHFGTAFPEAPGGPEVDGLFVLHESEIDGTRERRLSTMLVFNNPLALLSPDLGFPETNGVRGLVGGSFSKNIAPVGKSTLDLALAVDDAIRVRNNDGFGGSFSLGPTMQAQRLLPETMARLPGPNNGVDVLSFFTRDGKIGLWSPDSGATAPTHLSADLRQFASESALYAMDVSPRSRIKAADIDGDGRLDLAVLLIFDLAAHIEGTGLLMILRGDSGAAAGDFPFFEPMHQSDVTKVHGNSSSFTLADFVLEGSQEDVRQELALAVPVGSAQGLGDGDHVRFYRLIQGQGQTFDRWQRSYSTGGPQVLLAGNEPTQVASADFDGNGTVDLLVSAAGDSSLRLFLNNGLPASPPDAVAIEAFVESFSSPQPTAAGEHRFLNLGDINGDGNVDVLLTTEDLSASLERDTSVAFYLSSGTGELVGPTFASQARLGNRDAPASIDLGDFNGDQVPDLSVGWDALPAGARNVIVLFGGSR